MKKIKMTLAVVLCCAMTTVFISCDKDEELVKPTSGSTVITIDNISLYQDLDMLDYIQEYISEGKMVVTDTLLIYDAAGKLVNKLGVEANNLQPQIFEAKDLPNGTYTVVAWQAVRGGRSENRAWVLSDDEQLSTVNLNTKYGCISWVWATGIASATVAIDGSNVITVTINTIDGTKVTYTTGAGGETVTAALTRLDGNSTVTGSVDNKIANAVSGMSTSTDVPVASYTAGTSGSADVITFTGSVSESNGVVGAGSADDITMSTITDAEIAALFGGVSV